ncbi:hypothetical protein DFW101_1049 [Solidesulfovibrio carbinoliphilus subsp. oakridgensis]|uniref:Uncharacterized protein n=1 Tax=Solidesulfovibrio carbinoliphilus subsp. oakridgensis TaxID=694327 RepID=G7Q645_9BACT|nr:hypothetical protein [Solidesulfovibrio carbinoliphilus]EHJ47061.1 hypothetical protein DFW101_1049 [Solidesulfovibrio carbinoliphilus subsp. oakridgensis]
MRNVLSWRSVTVLLAAVATGLVWLALPLRAAENQDLDHLAGAIASLNATVSKGLAEVCTQLSQLNHPQWEYTIAKVNLLDTKSGRSQTEPDFSALGRDGWELVYYDQTIGYFFKRRAK